MYRKELKGWNRDDGIVKEDSRHPEARDILFNIL